MKEKVLGLIFEISDMLGCELIVPIENETVLLETGLDSMGFAVLVARLEEDLGYDPFSMMDEPVYPRTLGEFVNIYQKFAS